MAGFNPMVLNAEEDFNTILNALDALCSHQENLIVVEATTKAYLEASVGKAEGFEPSEEVVKKAVNLEKVYLDRSKIRDKFITLKAKVVETKNFLRLKNEIDSITN